MGLFLSMSGVIGPSESALVDSLQAYAKSNDGFLKAEKLTTEDDGCLVISEGVRGITVLYPSGFCEWDDASLFLSLQLSKPVFSFHIHDGDLWMYSLYENGQFVDQFNPLPDYWQELTEEDRKMWAGSALRVAKRVPGLAPEEVSKYLVFWGDDVLESDERKKAYPTDEFYYGDDWQLTDFMKKIGLDYPVDERGEPRGVTYRFECEPKTG